MARSHYFVDRYQTRLAPPPQAFSERIKQAERMCGDIDQQLAEALQNPLLDDPRAKDLLIKLGALEVHLALAHGKANDILVALEGLKGG